MSMDYNAEFERMGKTHVCYEDFGAAGDGKSDDFAAVKRAHEYANLHKLRVITNPTKSYYFAPSMEEIPVMTDVDWSTSNIIIDDSALGVDNRRPSVFIIKSEHEPITLSLPSLKKGQKKIDAALPLNCLVVAENAGKKQFVRVGLNVSAGNTQTDCFIVDQTGHVLTPIIWDFDKLTSVIAKPIDERVLRITGGIITTIANQVQPETGYYYYGRGIAIRRSNVIFDGMVHHIRGEKDKGSPYHGFVRAEDCAHTIFRNCHFTGHKIYTTIGAANLPVMMGTYDISMHRSVDIQFHNCREDNIMDKTLWGVFTSNYCKDILVDGCTFSRTDSHMDVTNYTIRNTHLGWQGLNAIGHGRLLVENVVIMGPTVVSFRGDYGSNWDGDVTVKDVTWYPSENAAAKPCVFGGGNTGDHDFGYPCSLPRKVTIENLRVMDGELTSGHTAVSIFPCSPETNKGVKSFCQPAEGDHPYVFTEELIATGLSTESGKGFQLFAADNSACYGREKGVSTPASLFPNFRATLDDVDRFTYEAPSGDLPAGCHRLVPSIKITNCRKVLISGGARPARVRVYDSTVVKAEAVTGGGCQITLTDSKA